MTTVNLQPVDDETHDKLDHRETDRDLHFIDLHTHSRYSDGLPTLEQIEEHCLRQEMAVSLTDHNEIRGSVKLHSRGHIACIPGLEVGTVEGLEFLVYFDDPGRLEDYYVRAVEKHLFSRFMVRSRISSIECLDIARDMDAFISLAHPFAFGRKSIEFQQRSAKTSHSFVDDILARVDAVELFNGGVPPKVNRQAADFVESIDKPITVGSDSHRLKTFGSCGMYYHSDGELPDNGMFGILTGGTASHHDKNHGSISLTLPVIMLKHTMFFMVAGNRPNRWAR